MNDIARIQACRSVLLITLPLLHLQTWHCSMSVHHAHAAVTFSTSKSVNMYIMTSLITLDLVPTILSQRV